MSTTTAALSPGIERHARWKRVARLLLTPALAMAGAAGGAIAFNIELPSAVYPWGVAQGCLFAVALLAIAARLCQRRRHVVALTLGWYLGSMAALPFTWLAFFHNGWGWIAWFVLASLLALPASLAPRRWPALGLVVAIMLASVPPLGFIGLCTPLIAAYALFPGARWLGLALCLLFFALSAFRSRPAVVLQILLLGFGLAVLTKPAPAPPADAWAAITHDGLYSENSLTASFQRQDASKATVNTAIDEGAKLILMPETMNPAWDDGQAYYWQPVKRAAKAHGAQVLLGVYTNPLLGDARIDGLVDLTTGHLYPSRIAMPIAMWRPWSKHSFPLHLDATAPIPTRDGPAAYLICYEELLAWPLALQEAHARPALLFSAANQWFDTEWLTRPQERSVAMQARLWGLPLLRAVNGPDLR